MFWLALYGGETDVLDTSVSWFPVYRCWIYASVVSLQCPKKESTVWLNLPRTWICEWALHAIKTRRFFLKAIMQMSSTFRRQIRFGQYFWQNLLLEHCVIWMVLLCFDLQYLMSRICRWNWLWCHLCWVLVCSILVWYGHKFGERTHLMWQCAAEYLVEVSLVFVEVN